MTGQIQQQIQLTADGRQQRSIRAYVTGNEGIKCLIDRIRHYFTEEHYRCPDGFRVVSNNLVIPIHKQSVEMNVIYEEPLLL